MKIIDVVKNDNMAYFNHYCGGNLYYTVNVEDDIFLFSINTDPNEVGSAVFSDKMKAITLMRWIRKCLESEEMIKIR